MFTLSREYVRLDTLAKRTVQPSPGLEVSFCLAFDIKKQPWGPASPNQIVQTALVQPRHQQMEGLLLLLARIMSR